MATKKEEAAPAADARAALEQKADAPVVMTEALQEELNAMSTTQRAAVLMLLLGEQQAADILKFLKPKEVQALGGAMVSVSDLSQEAVNVVLDQFVNTLKKQTSIGQGSSDYVEKVFKRALGADKAASVLGRIMPGSSSKGLEILQWMDARSIAEMIRLEHPQVIAIILSVLEFDVSADVLSFLPPDVRAEVVQRVASLETVQPSAMTELEDIMRSQFSNNSSAASSSFGGVKTAAQRIQDSMFTFENLTAVDNRGIQTLMRGVEPDMLMTALKGAPEFVKDKFFGNMSSRARVMFVDEMEGKGPLRIADVEEAQKTIMRIARKMSDAGELVLVGRGDDFV